MDPIESYKGPGGTRGGTLEFLIGLCMAVAGGWLLSNHVTVSSGGGWTLGGYNSFGLSLIPFIAGVGLLFFNGRSVLGWLLMMAGLTIIGAGVLMNMSIYFRQTSLFNTLMMLVLLFGGLGLLARSVRDHEPKRK